MSMMIKNGVTLWCFNCNLTENSCKDSEHVVFLETEDNYCTIGFIDETVMFRVSF